MNKIVLIDDNQDMRDEFQQVFDEVGGSETRYELEIWNQDKIQNIEDCNKSDSGESNAAEDVFKRGLDQEAEISLVVVDHDLSKLGLRSSKTSIVAACRQSQKPVCTYHRAPSQNTTTSQIRRIINQQHSYSIEVNISSVQGAVKELINIADGFQVIKDGVYILDSGELRQGPATIIARILGQIEQESYFLRYMESASLFSDILDFALDEPNANNTDILDKLYIILGYWLYNYVLQFPGIILNQVAAASYLNLSQESFEQFIPRIENCRYRGPFSSNQKYWWRYNIDDFLIENDVNSGYEMLTELGESANQSVCHVSHESPAGFYSIANGEPISELRSKGNISWIPAGADLCRIDESTYDRIAPLIGF